MATLQQALTRIDTICPNAWDDAAKLLWLNECESMIQTRILGIAPGECVTYDVNSDRSTVLLVPAPFDRLYVYYVIAMCDYAAHETAHYADSMALFNAALDEYAKWYQRTNGAAASVPGAASQIAANTAAHICREERDEKTEGILLQRRWWIGIGYALCGGWTVFDLLTGLYPNIGLVMRLAAIIINVFFLSALFQVRGLIE